MKYYYILFIFLASYGVRVSAQTLETKWLHSISSESSSFLNNSSKTISNTTSYIAVGLPVILLAEGYLSDDEKTVENGWYVVSSLAVSSVFTLALKYGINRQRPYETYPGYIIPKGSEGSPSFPSGHTSMAFSLATSLSISYPKWYVIAPSMIGSGRKIGFPIDFGRTGIMSGGRFVELFSPFLLKATEFNQLVAHHEQR